MSNDLELSVKEFRAKFNYSQKELAEMLGVSIRAVQKYEAGGGMSPKVSRKFVDICNRIESSSNATVYIPKHVISVPVVPYSARAGSLSEYEQIFSDETHEQQPVYLDEIPHGRYLVFTIGGDSMEDEFRDRDRVLARHIKLDLWKDSKLHLRKWSVFVIVTKSEGIIIKNITEHDVENHTIVCHSYNPNYEDIKVDLSDVIDIYNVVQLVRRSY